MTRKVVRINSITPHIMVNAIPFSTCLITIYFFALIPYKDMKINKNRQAPLEIINCLD
jgi:hypothetical protein